MRCGYIFLFLKRKHPNEMPFKVVIWHGYIMPLKNCTQKIIWKLSNLLKMKNLFSSIFPQWKQLKSFSMITTSWEFFKQTPLKVIYTIQDIWKFICALREFFIWFKPHYNLNFETDIQQWNIHNEHIRMLEELLERNMLLIEDALIKANVYAFDGVQITYLPNKTFENSYAPWENSLFDSSHIENNPDNPL